ncbi:hypothetical protein C2G38_2105854 [Gigaspora rosea]|uniref:Uncharacterized protein n=1 Tax=Gigaspora rosea TaxID=44941 RepID=A0A397UJW6_9GLOM|nr:hypothetical protein C2G38_2105854 [Gigaspora rosea]
MVMFIYNCIDKNCRIQIFMLGTRSIYEPWTLHFFSACFLVRVRAIMPSMLTNICPSSNNIIFMINTVFYNIEPLIFIPFNDK